jgi:hypothetical protein
MTVYKLYKIYELNYTPEKTYFKGDTCIFLGKEYECIAKRTRSTIPHISSDWDNIKTNN